MDGISDVERIYRQILEENLEETVQYRRKRMPFLEEHEAVEVGEMPRLIRQTDFSALEEQTRFFLNALHRIPKEVFQNETHAMAEELGAEELRSPLFLEAFKKPCNHLIARPDGVFGPDGFRFFEQNISSAINGFADRALTEYYSEHPVIRELQEEYDVQIPSFYDRLISLFKTGPFEGKTIGLLDTPTTLLADSELPWMYRYLKEGGVDILLASREGKPLEVRSDGVFIGKRRIDVVYRSYTSAPLFFDKDLESLVHAHLDGRVEMFHDPTEILYFDKGLLAVLSNPETNGFLNAAEKELLSKTLPWTRLLRKRRVEFEGQTWDPIRLMESQQRRFVIKRGYGSAGNFVFIGAHTRVDVWKDVIRRGQDVGNWIMQEYIETDIRQVPAILDDELKLFTYKPVDSPYMIDGKIAGVMTRESGWYTDPETGNLFTNLGWKVSETIGVTYREKNG